MSLAEASQQLCVITTIDGLEIHENDNLGMVDGKILVSNPDMHQTLTETLKHMLDEDSENRNFLCRRRRK